MTTVQLVTDPPQEVLQKSNKAFEFPHTLPDSLDCLNQTIDELSSVMATPESRSLKEILSSPEAMEDFIKRVHRMIEISSDLSFFGSLTLSNANSEEIRRAQEAQPTEVVTSIVIKLPPDCAPNLRGYHGYIYPLQTPALAGVGEPRKPNLGNTLVNDNLLGKDLQFMALSLEEKIAEIEKREAAEPGFKPLPTFIPSEGPWVVNTRKLW